jgi:hypothetical protein
LYAVERSLNSGRCAVVDANLVMLRGLVAGLVSGVVVGASLGVYLLLDPSFSDGGVGGAVVGGCAGELACALIGGFAASSSAGSWPGRAAP